MGMADLRQLVSEYSSKELGQRKTWYSAVAEAYDRFRPRYSDRLLQRVIELAELPVGARILEIGCGPGIATLALAERGFSIVGLEPNPDFCQLAQAKCRPYPNVEVRNLSLEEWEPELAGFQAVLAATSIHWIPANIAYPKAAAALQDNGSLILLWNNKLEPAYEVYQALDEVYQTYAPQLAGYESPEKQSRDLQSLGQMAIESGYFTNLAYEQLICEAVYTVDDYLALLNTYSQYLALEPQVKQALFTALREKITQMVGNSLPLTYVSAFHVDRKTSSNL